MDKSKYVIDGYLLTLDESSYLVMVDRSDSDRSIHEPVDLPRWVFESPYTIWLASGEESLRVRAFEGERVRHNFIVSLQKAG